MWEHCGGLLTSRKKDGMTRRIAKLLLPGLALLLAVSACTSGDSSNGGGETSNGPSQLNKVLDAGTLRVAVLPDFPPNSVQKPSGEFVGYEVDIAQQLADALGVELELVPTDGSNRLPLLQSDRVDVNISSWTATNERAQAVGFTIPYVAQGAGVLFNKSDPIASLDDLAGKKVSVARGSTNDTIMTEFYPETEVVRFESIADALAALRAGKVDAAVESFTVVNEEGEASPDLEALDAPPIRPSIISMGVLPGDQVWMNYLDNFIRNLITSGTNEDLYRKWYGRDLPDVISMD